MTYQLCYIRAGLSLMIDCLVFPLSYGNFPPEIRTFLLSTRMEEVSSIHLDSFFVLGIQFLDQPEQLVNSKVTIPTLIEEGYVVFRLIQLMYATDSKKKSNNKSCYGYIECVDVVHNNTQNRVRSRPMSLLSINKCYLVAFPSSLLVLHSILEEKYKKNLNPVFLAPTNTNNIVEKDASGFRTLFHPFDGKYRTYINKTNSTSEKLQSFHLVWRMCNISVYKVINQSRGDLDFNFEVSFNILVTHGHAWNIPIGLEMSTATSSTLPNTKGYSLLSRITKINFSTYFNLLTCGWCRHPSGGMSYAGGTISLESFSTEPYFAVQTTKLGSQGDKCIITSALRNVEHFFVFALGNDYNEMCKDIIYELEYGKLAQDNLDLSFIRYLIEYVFYQVFMVIQKTSKEDYFNSENTFDKTIDITCSSGVARFLKSELSKINPTENSATSYKLNFNSDFRLRFLRFGTNNSPYKQFDRSVGDSSETVTTRDHTSKAANTPTMWWI